MFNFTHSDPGWYGNLPGDDGAEVERLDDGVCAILLGQAAMVAYVTEKAFIDLKKVDRKI